MAAIQPGRHSLKDKGLNTCSLLKIVNFPCDRDVSGIEFDANILYIERIQTNKENERVGYAIPVFSKHK